jgi:hypothetical protein
MNALEFLTSEIKNISKYLSNEVIDDEDKLLFTNQKKDLEKRLRTYNDSKETLANLNDNDRQVALLKIVFPTK